MSNFQRLPQEKVKSKQVLSIWYKKFHRLFASKCTEQGESKAKLTKINLLKKQDVPSSRCYILSPSVSYCKSDYHDWVE